MSKVILFVEDDLPTIDVYKTALKQAGFEMEAIRWGKEAIEKIREIKEGKVKKPDLILLDLILPDLNGIEVLEEIRKHKETEDLPVFVFTNYADQKLEKRARELRAERYLLKTDCIPRELVKMIKETLKQR